MFTGLPQPHLSVLLACLGLLQHDISAGRGGIRCNHILLCQAEERLLVIASPDLELVEEVMGPAAAKVLRDEVVMLALQ